MKDMFLSHRPRIWRIPGWIQRIATEPNQEAYWWHSHNSPIGYLTVFAILLTRLSPLQLLKQARRFVKERHAAIDQERTDFHSQYTEIYFLAMLVLSYASYLFINFEETTHLFGSQTADTAFRLIFTWLLIESIGWVLYYSFYRIIIERQFSIYSLSEYLVSVPVVVAYQFILIAIVFRAKLITVAQIFFEFGNADAIAGHGSFLVAALRTIYLSLLVAYVVSLYPKMRIKLPLDFVSIGMGNAYVKYYERAALKIPEATIAAISPAENTEPLRAGSTIVDFKKYSAKHDSIYIISTPTPTHFLYISQLANAGRHFFVEKPVVGNPGELSILEGNFEKLFGKAFFLQYYILEKALPLTYLNYPFAEYEKFLRSIKQNERGEAYLEKIDSAGRETLLSKFSSLGNLTKVEVNILEGSEKSENAYELHWSESVIAGGMLLDLGIHAFSMLRVLIGLGGELTSLKIETQTDTNRLASLPMESRPQLAPTKIHFRGSVARADAPNIEVEIRIGKHIDQNHTQRNLSAYYEHGHIYCDLTFDMTTLRPYDGEPEHLLSYSGDAAGSAQAGESIKYYGMFDMGIRQMSEQWQYRVDIPHVQIRALRDIFRIQKLLRVGHSWSEAD